MFARENKKEGRVVRFELKYLKRKKKKRVVDYFENVRCSCKHSTSKCNRTMGNTMNQKLNTSIAAIFKAECRF